MSPELWHQIAIGFLIVGILALISTIFFSVKFQLFSMIRSELESRKNNSIADEKEYFKFVEDKNKSNRSEQRSLTEGKFSIGGVSYTESTKKQESASAQKPSPSVAPPEPQEDFGGGAATVVTSRGRTESEPQENFGGGAATVVTSRGRTESEPQADNGGGSATVVISSRNRRAAQSESKPEAAAETAESKDDFVILETVMEIHGAPSLIASRCGM